VATVRWSGPRSPRRSQAPAPAAPGHRPGPQGPAARGQACHIATPPSDQPPPGAASVTASAHSASGLACRYWPARADRWMPGPAATRPPPQQPPDARRAQQRRARGATAARRPARSPPPNSYWESSRAAARRRLCPVPFTLLPKTGLDDRLDQPMHPNRRRRHGRQRVPAQHRQHAVVDQRIADRPGRSPRGQQLRLFS
jgi:hypothetical protein